MMSCFANIYCTNNYLELGQHILSNLKALGEDLTIDINRDVPVSHHRFVSQVHTSGPDSTCGEDT